MIKAIWNGVTLAEASETIVVEGNHYFPRKSVRSDVLEKSPTTTQCSWKGTAQYFHVRAAGQKNMDAAWYYPDPKEAAANIKNCIAFWRGVGIESGI